MKQAEFLELYQQTKLLCRADQAQAKRMCKLIRQDSSLTAGASTDSYQEIKNGVNLYRSLKLFATYAEFGNDFVAAGRSAVASMNYWSREQGITFNPLADREIVSWEKKGEVT